MGIATIRFAWLLAITPCVMAQEGEDGYLGVLNNNEAYIDSISNESGTLTGDFSTSSLLSLAQETSQWQLEGPVVVSQSGEILGRLSTVDVSTDSIFNESIWIQIPFIDRCEACIGSINNNFSIDGAKVYDSQSTELKELLRKVNNEFIQR